MALPLRESIVTRWFGSRYGDPTPAQSAAWPLIRDGRNVLIASPTGTGKTLAAFLSVLNELDRLREEGRLRSTIHALYVSPLRALSYDLEKNLNGPLAQIYGSDPPIRVGLRTGDTPTAERRRQVDRPPHILLTTPESLCLLLSQAKWLPLLRTIRWVIVDEIHALAENKRGAHLSLSLERLDQLSRSAGGDGAGSAQRIGLSATVAPLDRVGQFLVGTRGACEVVDVSAARAIDLRVYTPLQRDPYPPSGFTGVRLIRELARLVRENRTTLVFTNTRSGAESATYWLRGELPELADRVECHHASLDRDVRQEVEDRLKRGELRAVVCSTSLELGIDIGSIDLVVMLATPKGVSKALQRTGRAGHDIHRVSRGLLMATNLDDLVECCATALLARRRHLDPVRLPEMPLDVLAQHLVSMGCTRRWTRPDALELVRGAYPYRDLAESEFDHVLDYLAGGGRSLRQQYSETFGKIQLDDDGFETRPGTVRRDFLQNVGVIPSEGVVNVRLKNRALGSVEEGFIRLMKPGDVFMIGGRPVRLERVGMMECFVERADNAIPTVPRWNANKMPLSNRVAEEIAGFRGELRRRIEEHLPPVPSESGAGGQAGSMGALNWARCRKPLVEWIAVRLDCGVVNAGNIFRMYAAQHEVSEIPTADFLLVEEMVEAVEAMEGLRGGGRRRRPPEGRARHYFIHSLIGRAANDALSRVMGQRLSRLCGGNAVVTPSDYGFVLTVGPEQRITGENLPTLLRAEGFEADLAESLARSELLQYHFRNAAQTGLMVYRNYFGEQKSVRKLQFSAEVIFNVLRQHEPDHVLLREARRDAFHGFLDVPGATSWLRRAAEQPIRLRQLTCVPPLSFALYATRIKEALLVENPAEMLERLYHHWWSKIDDGSLPL